MIDMHEAWTLVRGHRDHHDLVLACSLRSIHHCARHWNCLLQLAAACGGRPLCITIPTASMWSSPRRGGPGRAAR